MRFNPQEVTGSGVRLRYSVDLRYDMRGPADILLNVHAARTNCQRVLEEQFDLSTGAVHSVATEPFTGNRIASFQAAPGELCASYQALVDIRHRIVDPVRRFHIPTRPSSPVRLEHADVRGLPLVGTVPAQSTPSRRRWPARKRAGQSAPGRHGH